MKRNISWISGVCVASWLVMVGVALHLWGAAEIRANPGEVLFLTFTGAIWLMFALKVFPWLGLSLADDVIERRNLAALVSLCGATTAVAILYVGGSSGEGPSYWDNFFSAGLGTAGWFVLWIFLELGAKVSMSIVEERDLASGLRMCGFLLATALVLARSVAGDWVSENATIRDFVRDGWPAAALCAVALPVERFFSPSRQRPVPEWVTFGLLPAVLYVALASAWLWHLGAWEGLPR
jgi:hypothetical protein